MFKVGDIFYWQDYPFPDDPNSPIKPRYFIFLGNTPIVISPKYLYLWTTTGRTEKYLEDGEIRLR